MRQQGYELADEEVTMPLDQFKNIYCNVDGSVVYVIRNSTSFSKAWTS